MYKVMLAGTAAIALAVGGASAHVDLENWNNAELDDDAQLGNILHASVLDSDGNAAGEVEDVLIQPDGRIMAAVVEAGGVLGVGETYYRVPWQQLYLDPETNKARLTAPLTAFSSTTNESPQAFVRPNEVSVDELLEAEYASDRPGITYDMVDLMIDPPTQYVSAAIVDIEGGDRAKGSYALPWTEAWADYESGRIEVPYTVQQALSYGPYPEEG